MLKKCKLWLLCLLVVSAGVYGDQASNTKKIPYKQEIAPYVAFLEKQNQKPVDYVMRLFEKYDIVIICERFHAEATQYDFIFDLVSDPRFVEKVGHIYTETGTSTMAEHVHNLLTSDGLNDLEVNNRLLYLYRHFHHQAYWDKYNFYNFLKKVYGLNKNLDRQLKIQVHLSDIPFSWEGMTEEKYQQIRNKFDERDRVMADQIIKGFSRVVKSSQSRKKALVIMNYRHAFNDFKYADGSKGDDVGRYLFEAFPGRIANVMLNRLCSVPDGRKDWEPGTYRAVSDGKWDAAFAVMGNPNLGFDFKGSPFGKDYFDLWPYSKHNASYKDVFTGFIFYKPLVEHYVQDGIPGLLSDGFDKTLIERFKIMGSPMAEGRVEGFLKEVQTLIDNKYESSLPSFPKIIMQIKQWLMPQ